MKQLKIIMVAPTYFSDESIVGGGERYVAELARKLAEKATVKVLSFGKEARQWELDGVAYEVLKATYWKHFNLSNPLVFRFGHLLKGFDVVHVHQCCTWVSDIAALQASQKKQALLVTDHGGGGAWVLNRKIPVYPRYDAAVAQSMVAAKHLSSDFSEQQIVNIPGGVDTKQYRPLQDMQRENTVLFVGRLKPHKGVDVLLKAFKEWESEGFRLRLIGRKGDEDYMRLLHELAVGLPVEFIHDASDAAVREAYRSASVVVLPSVGTDCYGRYSSIAELMGFTLLEAQASGTPVVCSTAGGMKEFVVDGKTGRIVAEGDLEALAAALGEVLSWWRIRANTLESTCREHADSFSWDTVVEKHLSLYERILVGKTKQS